MKNQRLELTWIGKDQRPRLEPRILLEDTNRSYHAKQRINDKDSFDNRLIFGDNLLALKALEQEFYGKVKCVFIDPPYNTGSAFTHYDDGLEHSIWLGLMRDRLELIKNLLSEDGSLWITIDDNEAHYLKVMCDEIFGRRNFVANCVWQKKHTRANDTRWISDNHDHIICHAKNKEKWQRNLLPRGENTSNYSNPDNDPRGIWASGPCHVKTPSEKDIYEIITPSGRSIMPPAGTSWRFSREKFQRLIDEDRVYFGKDGKNIPRYKRFLSEVQNGLVPISLWLRDEVGDNQEAKTEVKSINEADVFSTPKPERLLKRVLDLATNPGDLVLDSFAGSGTTGAVAHKMGRRWIMIELGEHCHSHIIPRLQKVINGEDNGGISKAVNWQGGGGFRYYQLAPSLLVLDKYQQPIINPEYNAEMLAEALCKLSNFRYAPSEYFWWQHGQSTENDYLYATTQNLSADYLQMLAEEVGSGQSLLVYCSAFHGITAEQLFERFPNLTVKRIPHTILSRCEWNKDDYSLNVANLPMAQKPVTQQAFHFD